MVFKDANTPMSVLSSAGGYHRRAIRIKYLSHTNLLVNISLPTFQVYALVCRIFVISL